MKLGARMLKTGLAVAISLYAAALLGFPSPVFAGIAAVFAIQPSIYRSYQTIIEQIQANIIGAVMAIIAVFALGNDPFVIGFVIILVIGICMKLKMNESTISLALVAVIAIMETTDLALIEFALMRVTALTLGILSAFLVNLIFLPPKYETKLFHEINQTTSNVLQWLRVTTRQLSDEPALKGEIQHIQNNMTHIDQTYLFYAEERTYLKKRHYSKARKLILFRELIATTKKAFEVLKAFQQLDDEIEQIPDRFQNTLIQELDKVIHSHEKILLSSMGRIKKQHKETLQEVLDPNIPKLAESLINLYEDDADNRLLFLSLAAHLMEYHNHLIHLRKLLKSYQQFHQDEQLQMNK
ncbi:aromatic acid exporter family protein [Aquibacillus sp. 3ASR75-11]|uniref:Aromatic acid exporter family protein n=1 Tax=Terrihalobacillus insolitus TaxID=2950438 RepID=A0A9X3WT87_9BACI|nr:aromatic acid exporter family protein [Terrihalobacillus insolitus]MDC3413422.1 aromatic acid exporter family protein [Terrihalobacillus insolitus]MDC3425285.1 aromatic acid exporter family protein [Terrihalobacillus insolitus]